LVLGVIGDVPDFRFDFCVLGGVAIRLALIVNQSLATADFK
jgi:hypothetical protein